MNAPIEKTSIQSAKSGELIVAFNGNQPVATIKVYDDRFKVVFWYAHNFLWSQKKRYCKTTN